MSDLQTEAAAPLDGIKVLDLSRVLAGPWCTMALADLGAEVIKVEQPGAGDDTRHWGPPWVGTESAYYLCANRNKKSITLDLASPEGQAAVRTLAQQCDVLVENFKAGGLDKFGLGYEAIRSLNPRLVYCSISGYGRSSPLAATPGYDYVIQAEGGLMSVTGEADGEPVKVGVAVADLFTGMAATQAILAALIAQRRDGQGQHIDMALFDCQLSMMANVASAYLASGKAPRRYGNGHPTVVPYETFATENGRIVIAVGNDRQYQALCREVLRLPELADDPLFRRNADRVVNRDRLIPRLAERLATEASESWLSRLKGAGVPCGEVRDVGQALESREADARGMIVSVAHPTAENLRIVASPLRLSRTPVVQPTAPPLLGEHTREIAGRFGLKI